jgi:hypothetical protein
MSLSTKKKKVKQLSLHGRMCSYLITKYLIKHPALLEEYPDAEIEEPYKHSFVVVKEQGQFPFKAYSYSSVNKHPKLNEYIEELIIEKYKEFIEQEATFFVEITNKSNIKVDINYIKKSIEEFGL